MKLDNFKELLIKRAKDDPSLQLLIKYMRDDLLISHTVESLEKMAQAYSKKNPNHAVMHYGTHMDPENDPAMIHDAMSHHASQYKAALKGGNKALANKHAQQLFNMMHMSEKLTRNGLNDHSGGKLKVEAIDPKPWERSGYSGKNPETGKFSTDTKGWSRNGSDYASWLQGAPHEAYGKETDVHGHKGAYPLEEIKVNGKYLDINPEAEVKGFVPHEFDSHPIMSNYKNSPAEHTPEKHEQYLKAHDLYQDSPHMDSYFNRQEAMDPKALASRGSVKSEPVHAPVVAPVAPANKEDALAALANIKKKV
jgi:hypothetical protein